MCTNFWQWAGRGISKQDPIHDRKQRSKREKKAMNLSKKMTDLQQDQRTPSVIVVHANSEMHRTGSQHANVRHWIKSAITAERRVTSLEL